MNATIERPSAKRIDQSALPPPCTVLCCAGSRAADTHAAEVAAALAGHDSGKVILTLVRDPLAGPSDPILLRAADAKADHDAEALAGRLRHYGPAIQLESIVGSRVASITAVAKRRCADLLIIPDDSGDADSGILPNEVEQIAQSVPIPTIVVRNGRTLRYWADHQSDLKLFVAYDFSEAADEALRWAGALQARGECHVTVGYAVYPPQESWRLGIGEQTQMTAVSTEMRLVLEREIRERVRDLIPNCEVEAKVESTWGQPQEEILKMADESHADLILIGSHQRHGFGQFWLGSVSRAVLRGSCRNVMVIPAASYRKRQPTQVQSVRRVLVTTDLSDLGNRAVAEAYSVLPSGGSVCLMTVAPPDTDKIDLHFRSHEISGAPVAAELRALVPAGAEDCNIGTVIQVIESSNVPAAICQTAERFGADMICIASHGRSGLTKKLMGSVSHEVLARSHRPILVIRPPEN